MAGTEGKRQDIGDVGTEELGGFVNCGYDDMACLSRVEVRGR